MVNRCPLEETETGEWHCRRRGCNYQYGFKPSIGCGYSRPGLGTYVAMIVAPMVAFASFFRWIQPKRWRKPAAEPCGACGRDRIKANRGEITAKQLIKNIRNRAAWYQKPLVGMVVGLAKMMDELTRRIRR